MSRSSTSIPKLSDELWTIVLLFVRYRALTLDLLSVFCREVSRDALRMRLDRLQSAKWLVSISLASGERCYALGAQGQRVFGLPQTRGFPFTGDGLLQHLGIAWFCALAQQERLLKDEFRAKFPGAFRPGLPTQAFCLDQQDQTSLAWALVDHASEPRRFKAKAAKVIARCLGIAPLEQRMQTGQLQIVVITATKTKQARIEQALTADSPWTSAISVVAIPGLLQFYLKTGRRPSA